MLILVINCGSSSIKYQLFEINSQYTILAKGLVERIGLPGSNIAHKPNGKDEVVINKDLPDHRAALAAIEEALVSPVHGVIKDVNEIAGVGHRVVHGGEKFTRSILINEHVLDAIRENAKLAPLHNPPNITGIEVSQALMPGVPNVAVFDTAIHQTMPKKAYLYGLPIDLYHKHGIRKYGFHGTSHGYVAKQAAKLLNKPFETLKIITCHLGNGGSITAFDHGKSVDTSMGLTPLEGIVMGTRSGDIDPAIVLYLQEELGVSLSQTNDLLNKQSGLKGLCGKNDMRDIVKLANQGEEMAQVAIDVFCYRIQKYIGSYVAVLNGVNAIVFTAGIGENSPFLREQVLENFSYLGLKLDTAKNRANEQIFSTKDSKVAAMMIRTNEELVIAQDTFDIITRR
ncbi:MAG: acetate kinase [Planctomycetes bacterium GWF2_50_10]|nr:MAG: acetate kinase [Planctomycetes bacterium GWF2_50_10]